MTIITERQHQIIAASGKILTERGVSGLTIKSLASEMGFVESALYRDFKSKEDIIILMIKYLHQNIQTRIEPIIGGDDDSITKIKMIFKSQFHFLNQNRHFVIAMMSEGLLDDSSGIKDEAMKIFLYKMPIVFDLLTSGVENKLINPIISTDAMLHFLMGGFRTLIFKWKISGFGFDLEIEGEKMMEDYFTLLTQKS